MLGKLNHIAVVVQDLEAATRSFQDLLGARLVEKSFLPDSRTGVAVIALGGLEIELLSSSEPDTKVGRILREKGPGIHHLSYEVEDLLGSLAKLKSSGVKLLDETPRPGLHGRQIAFLDPQATGGVLIEMVQETPEHKKGHD